VLDLRALFASHAGDGAARDFVGATLDEAPQAYFDASPRHALPNLRQLVVHGAADATLPVASAREYAQAARAAGIDVHFVEIANGGHMDCLDPRSAAHAALRDWLHETTTSP
jgi:pimeloyl-ACP methyl ester carboxylesterase